MNAATPPRRWASAMTCWQTVVLPDDSGPKISVILPLGMPRTPRARSRAIEPVGMKSTCCRAVAPSFMIEPVPNCFSIDRIAASTALPRSAWARSAARSVPPVRRPLPGHRHLVTLLSPQLPLRQAVPLASGRGSALVGLLLDRLGLPRLPDQLRLLRRRLRERGQLRLVEL